MKVLLVFLAIGLLVYALIDCGNTPDEAVPSSLPRAAWYVVILLLPVLGPLFWIVASRTEDSSRHPGGGPGGGRGGGRGGGPGRGARGGTGGGAGGSASRGPRRPLGPDDDPDFLHGL